MGMASDEIPSGTRRDNRVLNKPWNPENGNQNHFLLKKPTYAISTISGLD